MAGSVIETAHEHYAKGRRVRVLAAHYAQLLPEGVRVLDVGTGDGQIARMVMDARPDVEIEGVETLVRPGAAICVREFDGEQLPYPDESWDYVSYIDVLHHCEQPLQLLREGVRVARRGLLIKDHLKEGFASGCTLRFMDEVGNRRFGVKLPYNYMTRAQWHAHIAQCGLEIGQWRERLGIYPRWADWLFGRHLHFMARLEKATKGH